MSFAYASGFWIILEIANLPGYIPGYIITPYSKFEHWH